jgi:hypothetical protein
MNNVTPIGSGPRSVRRDVDVAEVALQQAIGIIDVLQGAAAHGSIEPPSNEESLARVLAVVLDLLEKVQVSIWPPTPEHSEEEPA